MKLQYSIAQHLLNKDNIDKIAKKYDFYKLSYFREVDDNGLVHYYPTKDCLVLNEKSFHDELLKKMTILNNSIIPKTVDYIFSKDIETLRSYFLFSDEMIKVMYFDYKNWENKTSIYWRYDLLINENDEVKIIEFNSETPAGIGETLLSHECIFSQIDPSKTRNLTDYNFNFENNLIFSMSEKINRIKQSWETLGIIFWSAWDWTDEYEEDYINALHLTAFFLRQDIKAKLIYCWDLLMNENWVFYDWEKIDNIFTFYPLEWIFDDKTIFFDLYTQWKFKLLNNTLNLVTQNKRFWSYLYEVMLKNNVLTQEEKDLILELIPTSLSVNRDNNKNMISKAILFREWVGIDSKEYQWPLMYQERINQKKFKINTFYSNSWQKNDFWQDDGWSQEWYITLGVYFWRNAPIGIYSRFCENFVTDDTCYLLPVFIS